MIRPSRHLWGAFRGPFLLLVNVLLGGGLHVTFVVALVDEELHVSSVKSELLRQSLSPEDRIVDTAFETDLAASVIAATNYGLLARHRQSQGWRNRRTPQKTGDAKGPPEMSELAHEKRGFFEEF